MDTRVGPRSRASRAGVRRKTAQCDPSASRRGDPRGARELPPRGPRPQLAQRGGGPTPSTGSGTDGDRTTQQSQQKRQQKEAEPSRAAGAGERDRWGAARRGREGRRWTPAPERECPPAHAEPRPGSSPSRPRAPGAPLPRPAPCCRTRRWQARWCSCPRTSPPPSCRPAADPTSAGCSWPPRSIGAAAPEAERKPERQLTPTAAAAAAATVLCTTAAAGCGAPGPASSPRSAPPVGLTSLAGPAPAPPPAGARGRRPATPTRGGGLAWEGVWAAEPGLRSFQRSHSPQVSKASAHAHLPAQTPPLPQPQGCKEPRAPPLAKGRNEGNSGVGYPDPYGGLWSLYRFPCSARGHPRSHLRKALGPSEAGKDWPGPEGWDWGT